ncbi:hypothetical protein DPMN_165827 [Dreissena polymorpha]|uniref:Uncharacterized protein n=2 Tax=Dreissena polymorpha TaxID=45954 RepID=A0A9D4IUZ0_DREPO|nr:hypothetical protein DPMN_165827 [Dreissena polymorpha]
MCNTNSFVPGCRGKRLPSRSDHRLNRSGINIGSSAQHQFDNNFQPVGFRTLLKRFMCNVASGCRNRKSKKDNKQRSLVRGEKETDLSRQNSKEIIDASPQQFEMYPYSFMQYRHVFGAEKLVDRSDPHIKIVVGLCNDHPHKCTLEERP